MAVKIRKEKKQKRAAKKEVEIPVLVVKKAKEKDILSLSESNSFVRSSQKLEFVNGKDNLPYLKADFFSDKNLLATESNLKKQTKKQNFSQNIDEKKTGVSVRLKEKELKHILSSVQKEKIMWVSVALLVFAIFFVWLAIVRMNFFVDFGVDNFFNTKNANSDLQNLREEWSKLREQWEYFPNIDKRKLDANVDQQMIDKLKEKILLEGIKNKIEE